MHNSFPVGIKQAILRITEKKLKSAQVYPKQKYHKVACQIIDSLLKTKVLEYRKYTQFFDNVEEADEVLEKNVFAYHPGRNIVTFQSQSVELYIKIAADDFGIKLIDLTPADEDGATTSNQMDTIIQEEYPPITEEPSHHHPSNLKSPRENYGSKNHSPVSSIPSGENNVNPNQHSNREPSEISRELLTPQIAQITDEIIESEGGENEIK